MLSLRRLAALFTMALAAICLGCTSFHAALTCPKKGGPAWVQVSTPHFELYTDAGEEAARDHARDLEVRLAALAHVLEVPAASLRAKLDVVWFNRSVDYEGLGGHYLTTEALFRERSALDLAPQPFIAESRDSWDAMQTTQHELTHRLMRLSTRRLPVWLDEGMAEYYSTLAIKDGHIVLGELPPKKRLGGTTKIRTVNGYTIAPYAWAPPLMELVAMDRDTFYGYTDGDFDRARVRYMASLRLVHYFKHVADTDERRRFTKMREALVRGVSPERAFTTVFEASQLPALDAAYHRYLLSEEEPELDERRFDLPPVVPGSARTLDDWEVHLLWARLRPLRGGLIDLVKQDLAEAMEEGPGEPEPRYRRAVFLLRQGNFDDAEQELAGALARRPNDPRYLLGRVVLWAQRMESQNITEEQSEDLESRVVRLAKVAQSPTELLFAATGYRMLQRNEEAFDLLTRAVQKDPTCWACNEGYAEMLFDRDQLKAALLAVDQAMTFLPEGASDRQLRRLHTRIERKLASLSPGSSEP